MELRPGQMQKQMHAMQTLDEKKGEVQVFDRDLSFFHFCCCLFRCLKIFPDDCTNGRNAPTMLDKTFDIRLFLASADPTSPVTGKLESKLQELITSETRRCVVFIVLISILHDDILVEG
jgi:hypothetical protein